jgi:putative pyruvate formate lyase activating enzyme
VEDSLIAALKSLQSPCRLCPRTCGAKRAEGETGFCGAAAQATVASFGPHFGEERVLVGNGGSGTIFLSGCNLKCVFCQNFDISHGVSGRLVTPAALAEIMMTLREEGCENVNFVTPTHHAPQIAEAILIARRSGFSRPVVYNCGGYESVEALSLLDGLVDIYMPDAKFLDEEASNDYLCARDYPARMSSALREMQRQVGDLVIQEGLAMKGLLVRHLVMPGHLENSMRVIDFLASEVSPRAYVNVMAQYRPLCRAAEFPKISSRSRPREVAEARAYAIRRGLRLDE